MMNFPELPDGWERIAIFAGKNTLPTAQVFMKTGKVMTAGAGWNKWITINLHHPWADYLDAWGRNGVVNKELRLSED